jgi:hypothetical protein
MPWMMERWQRGDEITLRYTGIHDGRIRGRPGLMHGFAHYVVEDEDREDLLAVWLPAGGERRFIDLADRTHEVAPVPWTLDTLRLMIPGKAYSIMLFWGAARRIDEPSAHFPRWESLREERARAAQRVDLPREFMGWYVNLEAPFVRTAIGVDTSDNNLDILVDPDLSWEWKDEEYTQHWEDMGVFTPEDTAGFYAAGTDVIALVEGRRFPFDGALQDFQPPPHWGMPKFHPDWERLPGYDLTHTTGRRLVGVDHTGRAQ